MAAHRNTQVSLGILVVPEEHELHYVINRDRKNPDPDTLPELPVFFIMVNGFGRLRYS